MPLLKFQPSYVVFMVWIMMQQVAESKRSQTVRWIGNNQMYVERSGCSPIDVMSCCWRGRYGNLSECGQSHGCIHSWIQRRNLTGSTVPWDFVVFPLALRVTAKLLESYLGLVYHIAVLYQWRKSCVIEWYQTEPFWCITRELR